MKMRQIYHFYFLFQTVSDQGIAGHLLFTR